ncbi:tetratricopeptide repeat protein [Lacinutrix gracilariae]|uniref:Tetratricopeptide repeat protein n=1 Tax=Lacinutrix gracilariae TaxID=1747198 RepID=A0ABW5JX73_9FLAO
MIKFFRHIRQRLLSENKFGKYLKYAIGEIILVVIGIVIALQINNWNEHRKSNTTLKNYYNQILRDLAKDNNRIYSDLYYLESNFALHKEFVENLPTQKSPKAIIMSSEQLKYTTTAYEKFNASTIETLQETGDIKLIPTNIRNKLIALKNDQDILFKASNDRYENFLNEISRATALGYNPDLLQFEGKNKIPEQLYEDLKIEDNYSKIALIVVASYFAKNIGEQDDFRMLKSIQEDANSLFTMINEELGNPYKDIERVWSDFKTFNTLIYKRKSADEIIAIIKEQDRENPDYDISEPYINRLGYYYLNTVKQQEDALKVFKLNIDLYPESWNPYDSYGECLLRMGDKERAIKYYKKSLVLNPENENAIKVLSELTVKN